jgi:hypothetical protein
MWAFGYDQALACAANWQPQAGETVICWCYLLHKKDFV